ncbi:hypothetical protein [Lacunimicrobium album]
MTALLIFTIDPAHVKAQPGPMTRQRFSIVSEMPRVFGMPRLRCIFLLITFAISGQVLLAQSADSAGTQVSQSATAATNAANPVEIEAQAKSTAIALNYCRAAFHRIRKYPTLEVMNEEQDQILNNLNMQGIADSEVIRLYSEVLDEIARKPIRERESDLYTRKYKGAIMRGAAIDSLSFMLEVASAQYLSAVRTGANGFWDYRNQTLTREQEMIRLDKEYVTSVVQKSSLFLDTLWKLSQKRKIPDHYLVRGTDLDKLEEASKITDLNARLRVLNRMENYMTCYPPYWYYVGRTQQALGKFNEAATTYARLEGMGKGYFRRDEMLAAGVSNLALIQHHQGNGEAVATARRALSYTSDVWQANLLAAKVLMDRGDAIAAEDALFRNLDVDLEGEQSLASLVVLYDVSQQKEKLMLKLAEQRTLDVVPAPILLRAASHLTVQQQPIAYQNWLASSLRLTPQKSFGGTELILQASGNWYLDKSTISLKSGGRTLTGQLVSNNKGGMAIRFNPQQDWISSYQTPTLEMAEIQLQYASFEPLKLAMKDAPGSSTMVANGNAAGYQIATTSFEGKNDMGPSIAASAASSSATNATPGVEKSKLGPLPYAVIFDVRAVSVKTKEENEIQDIPVTVDPLK